MPRLKNAVPKYRKHKQSGQAIVTLNGQDFLLGPHHHGQIRVKMTPEQKAAGKDIVVQADKSRAVPMPLKAGDVLLFHCWMMHKILVRWPQRKPSDALILQPTTDNEIATDCRQSRRTAFRHVLTVAATASE